MENLRFHGLRHEATSRLFEKEFNPVEIATISGHKDTDALYTFKGRGFSGKIVLGMYTHSGIYLIRNPTISQILRKLS
jgi:integrase